MYRDCTFRHTTACRSLCKFTTLHCCDITAIRDIYQVRVYGIVLVSNIQAPPKRQKDLHSKDMSFCLFVFVSLSLRWSSTIIAYCTLFCTISLSQSSIFGVIFQCIFGNGPECLMTGMPKER